MREKIIDTAIEEFTKHGSKFTMNDVAKELGISKKTIYTIFESKQDVLVGIADRYARDFTDMREAIEQGLRFAPVGMLPFTPPAAVETPSAEDDENISAALDFADSF